MNHPDQPAAEAALAVCREQADVVERNLPGAIDDLDPERLHDLRVAIRRSRSVLRELRHVLPAEGLEEAMRSLKWVQQATNDTRDLDVHLLEWRADERLDPLLAMVRERRAAAFADMRRRLTGARFRRAWQGWRAYLDSTVDDGGATIARVSAKRIRRLYRRMAEDGAAIEDSTPPEALHELRKRGKELRYLLEHFGDLWPAGQVKPLVSALKSLQDVLGRHQDRHVQAAQLRALGADLDALDSEAQQALEELVDRVEAEQAAARRKFRRRFTAFADPAVRTSVEETFARRTGR